MNKEEVIHILGDTISSDGGLFCLGQYIAWAPGDETICLDSDFTLNELEAIVWWMRNTSPDAKLDNITLPKGCTHD